MLAEKYVYITRMKFWKCGIYEKQNEKIRKLVVFFFFPQPFQRAWWADPSEPDRCCSDVSYEQGIWLLYLLAVLR